MRVIEPLDRQVELLVCYGEEELKSTEYGRQTYEILKGYLQAE